MQQELYAGQSKLHAAGTEPRGETVTMLGEEFYCIRNYDRMPPFFMSIVSSSDHWMFISSTGGLSAGRGSAETSLFPYYTDDRITENHANTGPLAIFRVQAGDKTLLWQPFSNHHAGLYHVERNLYKNIPGCVLIFEETNLDLQLTFRTIWRTSDRFGFVKTSWIQNNAATGASIELVDGLQNLLPFGANTSMQNAFSNLLNAYKRNELEPGSGLGLFTLSSTLTDLAEPSESLKATVAWQTGLDHPLYLLTTRQLDDYRAGHPLRQETDECGIRGAYLVNASFLLAAGAEKEWHILADLGQDGSQIAALLSLLGQPSESLREQIEMDIHKGASDLVRIVAQADGLQHTTDATSASHHFANVMFNIMRGGIFESNYDLHRDDLLEYFHTRNHTLPADFPAFFESLPHRLNIHRLLELAASTGSASLQRLCYESLPLTFSRRHGDPSRPWNKFSINIKNPDGSRKLDYQGNWRDIFQNWEPLACSYPEFAEGMICKFLNATTADGYNPYRVTRTGIEWETPSPDDPWANIGYWGDHQIIYLQKLIEISLKYHPGRLHNLLDSRIFSHANVPYRIKPYAALVVDPFSTILFDRQLEILIEDRVASLGTDGKLLPAPGSPNQVMHVSLLEKLLILLLVKMSNLVPDGGIWMNTQRPEWNDANNALVGKGLSVVTLGYMRRFIASLCETLAAAPADGYEISAEVDRFYRQLDQVLQDFTPQLRQPAGFDPSTRRSFMDAAGQTGSDYRTRYYETGFSGAPASIRKSDLLAFLTLALEYVERSLRANQAQALYHSYNVLSLAPGQAHIGRLDEMLEGQVSILSSGLLKPTESLALLKNLRASRLYRADQHSYILYPHRRLQGFLEKNNLDEASLGSSALVALLVKNGDGSLISRDINGRYHFNGAFRNASHVKKALAALRSSPDYAPLVDAETGFILDLFEKTFNHQAFTGRSGTFFAYEGLGSIYWHMVSKLLLAAQEACLRAAIEKETPEMVAALRETYYDIRLGLGYNKTPQLYGAFPTDPYSHTPAGQGAKQPGMTGQVKEEIITRFAELGLFVTDGCIRFDPLLLRAGELSIEPQKFTCIDINGQSRSVDLPAGSLGFTFCQVPVILQRTLAGSTTAQVLLTTGRQLDFPNAALDRDTSRHVFERDDTIRQITFTFSA